MESVAAERLNKIGIRDHNIANGSASENEAASAKSPEAEEVSALVSALAHQQSESEAEAEAAEAIAAEGAKLLRDKNGKTSSDPSNLHVYEELNQVAKLMIKTNVALLPRPRSESCFSSMMGSENGDTAAAPNGTQEAPEQDSHHQHHHQQDHQMHHHHHHHNKKPKINLPLNPMRKLHSSIDKSDSKLASGPDAKNSASASSEDNNTHTHQLCFSTPKSPFLSLKSPPSVLTQPSGTLYPEKVRSKKPVTTPLTNVPPPPPPGTLPGYYLPPNPQPIRQRSQPQLLKEKNTPAGAPPTNLAATPPNSSTTPPNPIMKGKKQ